MAESAEDVDQGYEDAGDGVAADGKLGGAIHRAVEIGFLLDLQAAGGGGGLVDDSGVEFGIDRHLLARHGVERETGRDLGDAARRPW